MKKVLQIFLRDLRRIAGNPVAIIVTIGVALIPSLYAWCNILANWDPYANTSAIAVAVVNEDEGADLEGMGHVDVGDQVMGELADNHQLDWRPMDRDQALLEVMSGGCYAAIVMPPSFSRDLTSVVTGTLTQPTLDYYVNEKLNPVAPKVTDSGATAVEDRIDSSFVSTVSEVVAERLKDVVGTATDGAASGISQATDDVRGAIEAVEGLSSTIADTRSTCAAAREATASAADDTRELGGVVGRGQQTLADALSDLARVRGEARDLSSSLSQALASASGQVGAISATANHDIGALTADVGVAQGRLETATARLQAANSSLSQAAEQLARAQEGLPSDTEAQREVKDRLASAVSALNDQVAAQGALLDRVTTLEGTVADDATSLTGDAQRANDAIAQAARDLTDLDSTLRATTMVDLSQGLDALADGGGRLQGALAGAGPTLERARALLSSIDTTLAEADRSLAGTQGSLGDLTSGLSQVAGDLSAITSSTSFSQLRDVMGLDVHDVAEAMADPVEMEEETVFPVANYGSGVAPFYTNLALFVGGFVLVAIYKLEVDEEGVGPIRPWQGYFGRGLLLMVIGLAQALICCLGDLALGIQCVSPPAFLVAGLVESLVYVNLVYALSVAFKHIGKALAVLIVILQIPGSSGLYPIQMQPRIFQAIYPWLPFTYGNNAMREAIAGFYDGHYAHDLLMLLLFLVPALIIGVGLRRWLLNINGLFDRELAATDLMICERDPVPEANLPLSALLSAAMDNEAYERSFRKRAATFAVAYPLMVRIGFVCLFLVPLLLLIPLFLVRTRGPMFVLWIVGTLLIIGFLIVIEYLHDRFENHSDLSQLPTSQLLEMADISLHGHAIPTRLLHLAGKDADDGGRGGNLDEDDGRGDDGHADGATRDEGGEGHE